MSYLKKFLAEESGAVTVDWVVLTAAIVGIGTIVITLIAQGAMDTSTGLGVSLETHETSLASNEES